MPKFLGAAQEHRAAFVAQTGAVQLYVNVYGEQKQGAELVFYDNSLWPKGWAREWPNRTAKLDIPLAQGLATLEAKDPQGATWLLAWTYRVGKLMTTTGVAQLTSIGRGTRQASLPVRRSGATRYDFSPLSS